MSEERQGQPDTEDTEQSGKEPLFPAEVTRIILEDMERRKLMPTHQSVEAIQ